MQRLDGRTERDMRPVEIQTGVNMYAEGSALIKVGHTHVICTASVEEKVPPFLRDTLQGWVTSEYGMIPRATDQRTQREATRGKASGRTQEIQRLIGRSLRSVMDLKALGSRTIWIDCDVIQADGGTRTASITGAFVAMVLALSKLKSLNRLTGPPLRGMVAATSVGLLGGVPFLDLCYSEDSQADVDMNVVRTDTGRYIEVQGTGEKTPFTPEDMKAMLELANHGANLLFEHQRKTLREVLPTLLPRP
ncbi:MAG TPA: ribonuclease PH [Candidatus Polarisedimenticolia bacterium]|nr:ribonuclease PH [Candidatus Polarisedimenticolia bacterium]